MIVFELLLKPEELLVKSLDTRPGAEV
jgi:hypothetical protein